MKRLVTVAVLTTALFAGRVEAQVTTKGALLTLRSSNARVTASGNSAQTSGYASATARVTVRVTAGVSSVTIR